MTHQSEGTWMNMGPINPLSAWLQGLQAHEKGGAEANVKRFERLTGELHKAYSEACSLQMQALVAANDQFTHSLQALMRCRQPEDMIVAESNVLAALCEGLSLRAKTWAEVARKLGGCWSAAAQEAAAEAEKPAAATTETASPKRSTGR